MPTERTERYPTIRSRPVQNPAFSTFLSTLPAPVSGNSVTNERCHLPVIMISSLLGLSSGRDDRGFL